MENNCYLWEVFFLTHSDNRVTQLLNQNQTSQIPSYVKFWQILVVACQLWNSDVNRLLVVCLNFLKMLLCGFFLSVYKSWLITFCTDNCQICIQAMLVKCCKTHHIFLFLKFSRYQMNFGGLITKSVNELLVMSFVGFIWYRAWKMGHLIKNLFS